ncbi:hypothetical protein B296_00009786 [Ensete ventricosum]|uniref:Non-specific lipid-transfer protein n=1 Tax=Ensete ventricosum TaxID=4639 RepID=A0A427AE60_ENSVE|nr:hypothetical protein B296_00009786 [Ensete ventricosum]
MARSGALVVLALAVFLVAAAPRATEALTCGQVVSFLQSCIPYARGTGQLTGACCSGVRSLNAAAKTTPDRQTACSCLKSTVAGLKGIQTGTVAGIPGKCGVSVPYPISATVDCSNEVRLSLEKMDEN